MMLVVGMATALAGPARASVVGSATIASDLADYNPGQTVTLTGANWDTGGSTVHIVVNDDLGQSWQHVADVTPVDGAIVDVFALPNYFVAQYSVQATQQTASGTLTASTSFTDANPSANLDQCANDPAPSPSTDGCSASASDWVNGALGASKSVYFEGDSIPYRLLLDNLSIAQHKVIIEWDTTKSGAHAIDYITTYNRTVANANPCLGVPGCGASATFAIPKDPQVDNGSGSPITQLAGNFTLNGGTITSVSAYSYPDGAGFAGDKSAQIEITFNASVANPVLAWGGHISTRVDWGLLNSAVTISGDPFHTRVISLDGSGGNQDRALSAAAVVFPGSITIIKDATPEGTTSFPFTASPAPLTGFSLVDDNTSTNTKVFSNITNFQTYSVAETPIPAGWTLTGVVCSVTSPNGGSQTVSSVAVSINLKEGENVTCTYSDLRQAAHLIVIKHVINDNGGTATAADFTLDSGGVNDTPDNFPGAESPGTDVTLDAGAYNVTESGPAGYSATFSADCTGTIAFGQTKTCTVTNNDQTAHLKLVKTVTNDNGGTAVTTAFTLSATGPTPLSGAGGAESDVSVGTYTLSETSVAGYTGGSWSCVGGTQSGSSVTLALGQSATCTINNNDQTAHLTLVKTVTNDNGGTAVTTDFTLSAAGPTPISGAGGVSGSVNAGTYTLSETSVAGYTGGSWSCVGGSQTAASIVLALGESATCTINNNDQTAHLKLVKTVTNDNGGTATATDFVLSAAGPTPLSGAGGAESDVNAGSYALSETTLPGYTASAWTCVGGTQTGASVALVLGQSAVCTIINDDQAAHLTLVKTVTNDNGGTATATDFTLSAAGPTPRSGAGGFSSNVDAGSYALSETTLPGYTAGSWSCVGGTQTGASIALALGQSATCTITNDDAQPKLTVVKTVVNDNGGTKTVADFPLLVGLTSVTSGVTNGFNAGNHTVSETTQAGYTASVWGGDCAADGTVTLSVGDSKTCTITNDDVAPQLHLRKLVTNNNGGTALASNFTLTADGTGSNDLSGATPVDSGPGLQADTWSLSESSVPGYSASSWICVGGTQSGSNISVGIGGSATCTITNDDVAPKLHLRKVVTNDNGGTKTVADFTLTANGAGSNDLSGTSPVDSGATLLADTWALSETNVYGYSASAWSCVGGSQSGSNITVGIGGEATCTITNDDKPGTIIVQKVTKPVNTGSFAFTTTGAGYAGFTLSGGGTNTQTLNAGSYTVKETMQLGWVLTGIGGSTDPLTSYSCTVTGSGGSSGFGDLNTQTASISLKNGDTVTCVFENTGQGVTRTQGFWATHSPLANAAWFGGTSFGHTFPGVAGTAGIVDTLICGRSIDTVGKLMGAFWADVSKTSTGAKRSALDQARMQLLQQLIAAELNASAFGSVPAGGSGMFATWEAALCGTNTTAIKSAQAQAAAFNTQGDTASFTPGTSADSKNARAVADNPFWNIIKP